MSSNTDSGRTQEITKADQVFGELMADVRDVRDERPAYATFDVKPAPPTRRVWRQLAVWSIMIAIAFAVGIGASLLFDGLPTLFGDRTTHQVGQPGKISKDEAHRLVLGDTPKPAPTPQGMQEAIEEALGGYSASIVPVPAGTAPSTESTPNQNAPSTEVIIPFGALPRLIEIDSIQKDDGIHKHMGPLGLWW